MDKQIDLHSLRARKARLARSIGQTGYRLLWAASIVAFGGGVALFFADVQNAGYFAVSAALALTLIAIWYRQDLALLPRSGDDLTGRLSGDVLGRLNPAKPLTAPVVWQSLSTHWQVGFIAHHFLLTTDSLGNQLRSDEDMANVWATAERLADGQLIEPGHVAAALLVSSPQVRALFTQFKMSADDIESVAQWLNRGLKNMRREKPYFGGIGRDWANGFTPQLNRFGHNISLSIERQGLHFGWLTASRGVNAMKDAFAQGATAIALVGDPGVGKTSNVYALAQLLLAEKAARNLAHHQIIELNPSPIISSARQPGQLEYILTMLLSEASRAGHIVLFFDDAQLFFGNGTGSFDATQILLPALQSGSLQLIFAMTPGDYQRLKSVNPTFANLLTPVMLSEPAEADTMHILEDTALNFEGRNKILIAYEALREAYRLSQRYDQDAAYPGRAIRLLEQSLAHAQGNAITAASVQKAIEQTRGVKVGDAAPAEADVLLHLEEKIHERMINQSRAVNVVANALRRARAGVANQRRPIGSFLFLGPTGVGKTELAKAIAATYFGAESNMIRLDMSEYQQPEDVNRLLSAGDAANKSLLISVREQPFTVVLLDEIEKAHPNVLNLLLQLLDEGQLADASGRQASFRDCVIIATSNAGANAIREHIERGEQLESFEKQFVDELIGSNQFKPELLNRFDEIVLFRPLEPAELLQVVKLMMNEVNQTLAAQNITVELTDAAAKKIVETGNDPRLGARPMRRAIQRAVEDGMAQKILAGSIRPGDHVSLDVSDLSI